MSIHIEATAYMMFKQLSPLEQQEIRVSSAIRQAMIDKRKFMTIVVPKDFAERLMEELSANSFTVSIVRLCSTTTDTIYIRWEK